MLSWLRSKLTPAGAGGDSPRSARRVAEVGWLVDWPQATFIFDAPRSVSRKPGPEQGPKSAGRCPAVLDHEARLFEIRCPFDLNLALRRARNGRTLVVNADGERSAVALPRMTEIVHLVDPDRWREPGRPLVQIAAPWRFLADEPVWMTQLPPVHHHRSTGLPGVLLGGRFPIHLWPRTLMWAFEWHEPDRPLKLERGEPWFCVRFETGDPTQHVRLVEAQMTAELRRYCQGLDGVTSYVRQTFQLFDTAAERRPRTLLHRKPADGAGQR